MDTAELGKAKRLLLPVGLVLTIPAFYLVLDQPAPRQLLSGQILYALAALLCGVHLAMPERQPRARHLRHWRHIDAVLMLGALASIWPSAPPWADTEWLLRLMLCAVIFLRMISLAVGHVGPRSLLKVCGLSLAMLVAAGGGFYWLEPQVHSFADGLWLAFTTGATVGYGDIVPSTQASRVFAVFIVLLGYALLSLVTASIAALLVGEDEKLVRRELHADMRLLLHQIDMLREEIAAERRRTEQGRGGG